MERLGGRTCRGVRFASGGRGRAGQHTTEQEEGGERPWGRSVHGVVWVHAIGGVTVACDGAWDVRWVAGGRMERAGAQSVWVGERAGQHVPWVGPCLVIKLDLAAWPPVNRLLGSRCVVSRESGR